jgi:hypothetical protein
MVTLIWALFGVLVACLFALAMWASASESAARFPADSWDDDVTAVLAMESAEVRGETALERWDREAAIA